MNAQIIEKQTAIINQFFEVDIIKKEIVGPEHQFKLTRKTFTPQHEELMMLMARYPGYTLSVIGSKRKVEKKQTYAGLTMKLIKSWVAVKGTEAQQDTLANLIDDGRSYPTIKSWLLETFEIVSVNKMIAEVQEAKLAQAKSHAMRVRVVKKAVQEFENIDTSAETEETTINPANILGGYLPNGKVA